jgi:hypothetical protein
MVAASMVHLKSLETEPMGRVSILAILEVKNPEILWEDMLAVVGLSLELVVVTLEKALVKWKVARQKTLVVEMADRVRILGMLVAGHLETPVDEMLGVVR